MSPQSMNTAECPVNPYAKWKFGAWSIVRLLGSLKLAIPFLATIASVIAAATILEAQRGRDFAKWYVYDSPWFVALLGLLGVNIFCAAAARWPWKRHQTGFVITHCGLLVLLAGSMMTFLGGIEGQVRLEEGRTVSRMIMPQQSQITISWTGRPDEPPFEFVFEPGPANWRHGKTLDLGEVDGVRARVLQYYRHGRPVDDWLPDASKAGGPAVRFGIRGPQGSETSEQMLVDQGFGDEFMFGPIRLQLQRAANAAMLADFLSPPTTKLSSKGTLVAYCKDQAKRIDVEEMMGKRIALGDGIAVEIFNYFANAKPDVDGGFRTAGDSPINPMLEIKIHMPGETQPLQQVSFAKDPLLNLDPAYNRRTLVKFRYYHPAIRPSTAIEFMQAEHGELYCRVCAGNRVTPKGKVAAGSQIEMPGNYALHVVEHQPHVYQKISFEPVVADPSGEDKDDAAAEFEITAGGSTRTVWLQRDHPSFGSQALTTDEGPLQVRFGHGERKFGFSLKLLSFSRKLNPGGVGNAAFSSSVLLVDESRGVEAERVIAMNRPLTYRGLTFYQSGFDDGGHGVKSSTLSVGHDPGRIFKYAGSLLICLGIAIMFYMRAYFFKKKLPVPQQVGRQWMRSHESADSMTAASPDQQTLTSVERANAAAESNVARESAHS
jgi:ResB-like family